MQTVWHLSYGHDTALPAATDSEVRMPPVLAERLVETFSDPGGAILDPFTGFGTTFRVASNRDRTPYGIEFERERVAYVEEHIDHDGTLIHGDSRDLASYDLPAIDCVVTSPPFMVAGMETNPLRNYAGESDYASYLDAMADVFGQVRALLSPGGSVVLNVVNMKHEGDVTTLAWDLTEAIGRELHFDGEIVVDWQAREGTTDAVDERRGRFGYGFDHSYVLVFSKPS